MFSPIVQSNRKFVISRIIYSAKQMRSIDEFGDCSNSVDRYLIIDKAYTKDDFKENAISKNSTMRMPRQVLKSHYSRVYPEPSPNPTILHLSESCANMLRLALPYRVSNHNDDVQQLKSSF